MIKKLQLQKSESIKDPLFFVYYPISGCILLPNMVYLIDKEGNRIEN